MTDISKIPHCLNAENYGCRAVVETPRGSRIKFKFEPESGMFEIAKFLPKGFVFPFEFGFIPSTVGEDGDPLDVIVLMDEPAHLGCMLRLRLIGVVEMSQREDGKETPDPRLVGVPIQSYDYADIQTLSDLKETTRDQMVEYLELYNKNSDSEDHVTKLDGPERAVELVKESAKRFEAQR